MKKNRLLVIDYLRGYAIILMILMHCLTYFLKDKTAYFLWDLSHYVVPLIIFSSAYIFFKRDFNFSFVSYIKYLKKRIIRLLIPYYIFLFIFFIFLKLLEPNKLTNNFIFYSLILSGGVDINWLVVLFMFIAFFLPIISYLNKKNNFFYKLTILFSIATSVCFLFFKLPFDYRLTMWTSWLVIVFFAIFFAKQENKHGNLILIFILLIVFFLSRFLQLVQNHSLVFYNNKYPPNIYYLSYGMLQIGISYQMFKKWLIGKEILDKVFYFFSKNSYSLFFIHYLTIFTMSKLYKYWEFNWFLFTSIVFVISIVIQILINKIVFITQRHYHISYERKST